MQRALRQRPHTQNAVKQGNSVTLLKPKAQRCNKIFPSSEDTRIFENIGERNTIPTNSKSKVDKRLPVHPPVEFFNKKCIRKINQCGKERGTPRNGYQFSMKRNLEYYRRIYDQEVHVLGPSGYILSE
ncbi:hypothetical protein K7X08_026737 [Anisodus acutangulus]|uniref:Uncharacterized protein n=1 Tax=Anisodus acutangulus TaxID=402998 RepID=A0A9Q1LBQ5_9SOLA|nr:hypothetical protein K7X08_026737 [Anisodus acutangulus]